MDHLSCLAARYTVYLQQIHIIHEGTAINTTALLAINVFGKTVLTGITASDIQVYYTDYDVTSDVKMQYNHTITISKFTAFYDPEYRS